LPIVYPQLSQLSGDTTELGSITNPPRISLISIRYKTIFHGSQPPSRGVLGQKTALKRAISLHGPATSTRGGRPGTGAWSVLYRELINALGDSVGPGTVIPFRFTISLTDVEGKISLEGVQAALLAAGVLVLCEAREIVRIVIGSHYGGP